MNLYKLISGWLQRRDEEPKLNSQFFLTLRSIYISLKPENPNQVQSECMARIDELFRGVESWSSAYEIEQLLIHLYNPENLAIEMERRLVEVQRTLRPDEFAKYQRLVSNTAEAPVRRIILARMVNDLQWRNTINETRRKYIRITTAKSGLLFAFSVIVFALVYLNVVYAADQIDLHAAGLVAAASGFLGASFSMIMGQRKRLESTSFDDLKVMRRFGYSIPRALVGLGSATILYYLMVCGMIAGLAFPELENVDIKQNSADFSKVAKATVYSATGFNENSASPELNQAVAKFVSITNDISMLRNFIPDKILRTEAENIAAIATQSGSKGTQDSIRRTIFKNLEAITENTLGPTDLALLIVWCFLAGFSEQLVPKLLTSTENKINPQGPQTNNESDKGSNSGHRNDPGPQTSGLQSGTENRSNPAEPRTGKAFVDSIEVIDRPEAPGGALDSGPRDATKDPDLSKPISPEIDSQ